jgi:predicted nucleic acid-binding protein
VPPLRPRLILDSGGLSALAAGRDRARAVLARALAEQRDVVIPAVTIAESTTGLGPRDAAVNRVINAVEEIAFVDEAIARRAGELRHASGCMETVDALVAAAAVSGATAAVILTGEHHSGHLRRLTHGYGHVYIETA